MELLLKLVKEGSYWSQVGLHPHRRRRDTETDVHREGYVMIQQRLSDATWGSPKLAKARRDPPLVPLEEVKPCWHLNFGLVASGTLRGPISVALNHLCFGSFSQQS